MRDQIRALNSKAEILLAYAEARLYLFITPKQWLSIYVKHEMSKIDKKSLLSRILNAFKSAFEWINSRTLSTNSWKNALLISMGLVTFFASSAFFLRSSIIHLFSITSINASSVNSMISTSWQVSASVIGISFVLVIFLVEYLHKDRYESQIFPLFSQYTKFHFIVIFGLVTLASGGVTLFLLNINYIGTNELLAILIYNTILQLSNLALIIFLYGRTFEFIHPSIFLKIVGDELDKHTKQSVVAELKKRLGENYFHNICRDLRIEFTPFRSTNRSLESINAKTMINQPQAITDIHIGLVKRAAELAKINQIQTRESPTIVWIASIGNIINKENREIAYTSNEINIRTKAHLALAVKLGPPSDRIPRAISENLQISKDELIEAIHKSNVSTVQLLLDRYTFLIRSFLSAMSDYNVRFTMDMVENDSRLFSDWYVLSQIERDYYTILEEALRSTNREIIDHAIDFPRHIIYIADEFRDHLSFRRFARFFPYIYQEAFRLIDDKSLKEFVYDRIWRSLQDYVNLRIVPKLEDSNISNEDIDTYRGYALEIASVFNALLKIAIDFKDIDQFTTYGRAFNEMVQWLYEIPSERVSDLEHYLHYAIEGINRKDYEEELSKNKNIARVEADFNQKRQLIWLGIGGWLVHLVSSDRLMPESYKQWSDVVAQAFPDLTILYKTYLIDHNSRYSVSRDWTSWVLQEREEEEKGNSIVGGLIDSSWITKYYCQRGIELAQMDTDSTQRIIPSVNERDIFDEVSNVAETFRTSETWKKTFDFPADQIEARINTFLQIHRSISELLKEMEEDAVIKASINLELISEFKSRAIDSWNKSSTLRTIMKKIGKYEERPDVHIPDDLEAFGFNHLGPKAAFIDQNKIHFNDFGEGLGRNLGMSEDIRLSELLIESLPTVKTNEAQLDDTIYQNLNNLRADASNPILFCSRLNIRRIKKSRHYKPARNTDTHELKDVEGFDGTFDGAAIISIRKLGDQNILLLDLNHFPKLVQYRFEKGSEYPLSITIEPIDEKTADKFLANQPGLLIDKSSGEKIEREKAIRDLLQDVHLQILEKSRIEDINSIRGFRIQLEE